MKKLQAIRTVNRVPLAVAIGSLMWTAGSVHAASTSFNRLEATNSAGRLLDMPMAGDSPANDDGLGDPSSGGSLPGGTAGSMDSRNPAINPNGWTGPVANQPHYVGGLPATWFEILDGNDSDTVTSEELIASGITAISELTTGSRAYQDWTLPLAPSNWAHNSDFGLLHLNAAADVTISVSADANSGLRPGFSIWQGWDTAGGTRHTVWLSNGAPALVAANPTSNRPVFPGLSSMGWGESVGTPTAPDRPDDNLGEWKGTAWDGAANGTATLKLPNLPAGDYTIVIGGFCNREGGVSSGTTAGYCGSGGSLRYKVAFSAQAPGATGGLVRRDLNGDGKGDLVWRNKSTGDNEVWFMNGADRVSSATPDSQPKTWTLASATDFNGDKKADLLWREAGTGRNEIWLMDAGTAASIADLPDQAKPFSVVRTGDFEGDGHADLLWFNPKSGEVDLWRMNGAARQNSVDLPSAPEGKALAEVADFDGNGTPDLWWRDQMSGDNSLWLMAGAAYQSAADAPNQGADWTAAGVGDFDGDGKADVVWRNGKNGQNQLWLMDGATQKSTVTLPKLAKAWLLASVDDFDGDGDLDLLWRHKKTGNNALWVMDGTKRTSKPGVTKLAKTWTTPSR